MIYKLKKLSHLKDFKTRKEWLEAVWRDLLIYVSHLTVDEVNALLRHLTTKYERELIARRAVAVDRFSTGTHYKSVQEETWLSKQTLYGLKKGLYRSEYQSDWKKVRVRILKKKEESAYLIERAEPARYRRTKYGRMKIR